MLTKKKSKITLKLTILNLNKMKNFTKMFLAACLLIVFAFSVHAQSVGINADGSAPNSSAGLDVNFTNKGFLPPRMTQLQRETIASPATGLIIWCTNCGASGELQVYNGTIWSNITLSAASGTLPGAPTGVSATAGNTQALVSFTAPAYNGGSAIISYSATSSPGGFSGTLTQAGSGTITVTGLTNGTAYTFTVTATNAAGTSAASAASNAVTPVTVPGAPTIGTAIAGNAQASVPFTAPASNGGSAITSYTATSDPGNITGILNQAGGGTITVSGLTNGIAYTFTITATNAIGTGAASAASNSVTYATVPGAPIVGAATAGPAQASVPFTAPTSNGGSAITLYTATSTPGNKTGTISGPGSGTITVTGLTIGTAYTFKVTATNAIGTGSASAASNSVTPVAFAIGLSYGGGIIAYILQPGNPGYVSGETHGLIAATTDQSYGIIWATAPNQTTSVPGGTSIDIGTGLANTDKIITQNGAGTNYAAGLARAYNGGGYSDWYLPSSLELDRLYAMKVLNYGNFTNGNYWSSSEYSAILGYFQYFDGGSWTAINKGTTYYVRAVRAF